MFLYYPISHWALLVLPLLLNFAFSIAGSRDCLIQILQLEKHLKDQQVVRGALEKALGPDSAPVNNVLHEMPMPKVGDPFTQELLLISLFSAMLMISPRFHRPPTS